jgi:hypothetical protein
MQEISIETKEEKKRQGAEEKEQEGRKEGGEDLKTGMGNKLKAKQQVWYQVPHQYILHNPGSY